MTRLSARPAGRLTRHIEWEGVTKREQKGAGGGRSFGFRILSMARWPQWCDFEFWNRSKDFIPSPLPAGCLFTRFPELKFETLPSRIPSLPSTATSPRGARGGQGLELGGRDSAVAAAAATDVAAVPVPVLPYEV